MRTRIQEQQRYARLYRERNYPPGFPERLVVWGGAKITDAVVDLGCGRAVLARIFNRYTGVDFTDAGFPKNQSPQQYVVAFLHKLPEHVTKQPFDLAVCADVMEHLPESDVENTLREFTLLNTKRMLFAISCRPSNWRDEHGQLHLTIKPAGWWLYKFDTIMGPCGWRVARTAGVANQWFYAELLRA